MSVYPWSWCDPSWGAYLPVWRPQCMRMRGPMPMSYTVALAKGLQSCQRTARVVVRMAVSCAITACTSRPSTTHTHWRGGVQASRYTRATCAPRTTSVPGWQHWVLLGWMGPAGRARAGTRRAVHSPVWALLWWLHAPSVVVWRGAAKTVALHMASDGCRFSGASRTWRGKRRAVAADVLALRPQTWQTAWGWRRHGGGGGVHRFGSHCCGLVAGTHVLSHSTHRVFSIEKQTHTMCCAMLSRKESFFPLFTFSLFDSGKWETYLCRMCSDM